MKKGQYEHVLGFALEHPWAVLPSTRRIIAGILAQHLAGQAPDPAVIQAALASRKNLPQPVAGGAVAIIPVYGVLAPRVNLLSDFSGGTTCEALTAQLHEAVANTTVKTIVFDVDSPGGNVAGVSEFAREILKARTKKPIIAQCQFLCASGAYAAMACCTEIVAAPSARVGAIEVYTIVDDLTEQLALLGIKREIISGGKWPVEGADEGAISPAYRAHLKALCESAYTRHAIDIAAGRGVKVDDVRNSFGQGRCVDADEALSLGMIDRIGTLSDTLARVMTPAPATGFRAQLPPSPIATSQEPPIAAATLQERSTDATWQNGIDAGLLALDL